MVRMCGGMGEGRRRKFALHGHIALGDRLPLLHAKHAVQTLCERTLVRGRRERRKTEDFSDKLTRHAQRRACRRRGGRCVPRPGRHKRVASGADEHLWPLRCDGVVAACAREGRGGNEGGGKAVEGGVTRQGSEVEIAEMKGRGARRTRHAVGEAEVDVEELPCGGGYGETNWFPWWTHLHACGHGAPMVCSVRVDTIAQVPNCHRWYKC